MEIRGYKRIKKKDIKRWFKGSNLIVYVLILLLLLLILLFAFKTIVSMHNDNVSSDSDESADTTEEDTGSTTEESAYIAKNQSYKIRINVSRNIAIIYSINSNNGFDNVVKAFMYLLTVILILVTHLYQRRLSGVSLILLDMVIIVQDLIIQNIYVHLHILPRQLVI